MSFWRRHRPDRRAESAATKAEVQAELAQIRGRWPEINYLRSAVLAEKQDNHWAERIGHLITGETP